MERIHARGTSSTSTSNSLVIDLLRNQGTYVCIIDAVHVYRGKAGRIQGNLMGVMAVMKGTPTTYNKDFQECWEMMYDTVDNVYDCVRIATGVLSTLQIRPERMLKGLSPDMLATDLAEYLVRKGVPFRETHHISGRQQYRHIIDGLSSSLRYCSTCNRNMPQQGHSIQASRKRGCVCCVSIMKFKGVENAMI